MYPRGTRKALGFAGVENDFFERAVCYIIINCNLQRIPGPFEISARQVGRQFRLSGVTWRAPDRCSSRDPHTRTWRSLPELGTRSEAKQGPPIVRSELAHYHEARSEKAKMCGAAQNSTHRERL